MRYLLIGLLAFLASSPQANDASKNMNTQQSTLFDFTTPEDVQFWQIVNDSVMGGRSLSTMTSQLNSTAIFKGTISLENNGGFASIRTMPLPYKLLGYAGVLFRVKGDGKPYQFRLRTGNRFDGIAYSYQFATEADEWIDVTIPFTEFVPVFRGRILNNVAPIAPEEIQQLGFLVTHKKADEFQLEIDWIKAYQK